MPNNAFDSGNVMTVTVQGLKEAQDNLARINTELNPSGLRSTMALAAGMVHRYLLGLGADHPPIDQKGVLPVITGRLKNSLFWLVESKGDAVTGRVTSNIAYGPSVEARRGFMAKTVKDQTGPVNELLRAKVERVISRKTGK